MLEELALKFTQEFPALGRMRQPPQTAYVQLRDATIRTPHHSSRAPAQFLSSVHAISCTPLARVEDAPHLAVLTWDSAVDGVQQLFMVCGSGAPKKPEGEK